MTGGRIGCQERGGLLLYGPEELHSPVCIGCKCLEAQGLKEFRHQRKSRRHRAYKSGNGCAGFLLGELFHWLEVRDERQVEARHV